VKKNIFRIYIMDEYDSNLQHDKQLADEYEKKIKRLFQDKTQSKRKKKKTPYKKEKKSPNFFGGKRSHKKRTRKHRN